MSKKVRRVRKSSNSQKVKKSSKQPLTVGATGIPISTPAKRGRRRQRKVSIEELREDYAYVIKDLRRIFILAIVMFIILIAANIAFQFV